MKTLYNTQEAIFHWYQVDQDSFIYDLDDTKSIPDTLQYRIYTVNETTGFTQIYPAVAPNWESVDITTSRLSKGKYGIDWTVDGAYAVGLYNIEWKVTQDGEDDIVVSQEFEVIANRVKHLALESHYCLIQDIRDRGIPATGTGAITDWKLMEYITKASQYIDRYCDRYFYSRYVTSRMKANLSGILKLPEPICCYETSYAYEQGVTDYSALTQENINVYARHLRDNNGAPVRGDDDRTDPKVTSPEYYKETIYEIVGIFGYTEWDGTGIGKTPDQIRLACINIALKYSEGLLGSGSGNNIQPSFADRIKKEKTATQEYELFEANSGDSDIIGGDTELLRLLRPYKRPMMIRLI